MAFIRSQVLFGIDLPTLFESNAALLNEATVWSAIPLMKPFSVYQTAATLLSLGLALSSGQVKAATFDQKVLDSKQVIAVAVPLAQGERYNLLILEQLSNARPCWQDAKAPGVIEPLLLKFDFTNICGRSTDSNGYSIRIAGEDKGINYRLSILKQSDHLKLVGLPNRSNGGPALEIARTEGLAPGFLKLILNPEWQLAKRTYQGKTLGHIYLARTTAVTPSDGAGSPYPTRLASNQPFSQTFTPAARNTATLTASSPFQSKLKAPDRSLRASAYSGNVRPITAPVEIQVPDPQTGRSLSSSRTLPRQGAAFGNGLPVLAGGILPVPGADIPMGRAGNEPDLIDASTPGLNLNAMTPGAETFRPGLSQPTSLPETVDIYRFRVYVIPANSIQQRTVKTLVPDSFRSSYKGRPVLQVGAFQDRTKADEVIELLNRNGINGILASNPE